MRRDATLALGFVAFLVGCAWVALSSLNWYYSQGAIQGQGEALGMVMGFYLYEGLAIALALFGAWAINRGLAAHAPGPTDSVRGVLSDALVSRGDVKVGMIAGIAYAAIYLLISSIIVYQPNVDFQSAYGATGFGTRASVCCGSPGAVPELIVYLSPQLHLGLQVLPLDTLFAFVVPVLVGFNVTVAAHALRNRALRSRAGWLGPIGIVAGLFTGCPTCAGLFLAGTVGGLGATSLAVALAPYQFLFVALSIPVLLASPFVIALYASKAVRAACAVPAMAAAGAAREILKIS